MVFLSLIAVLAIVHWTTLAGNIQRDAWFIWLLNRFRGLPAASSVPLLPMLLSLLFPLLILIVSVAATVYFLSANVLFFLYVPVLLYSLGRGNFLEEVNAYIEIANCGDSAAAANWIEDLRGHADSNVSFAAATDWKSLHTQALRVISYRCFERLFAVLFWFFIAGAVGAFLYRLSVIYREQTVRGSSEAQLADKWLWLIELPAVRLMGLTWAFVGNFDSCPWSDSFLDTESSSMTILNNSLRGALSAPTDAYINSAAEVDSIAVEINRESAADIAEAEQAAEENAQEVIEDMVGIVLSPHAEPAYSFALVKSSVPLYSRSLLFWVGAVAFATLFI